ncbi:carbohydrate kinase family protein [Patescibacteria group bacterium]|nr:carbohydrate kinase family protein [Patescibacteria group bacterium]
MYDIITIGSVTRDVFLKSGDFKIVQDDAFRTGRAGCFALGAKFEVPEVVFASGGGGANAAVTFARQGFNVGCIGRIGDDEVGHEIIEELKNEGVGDLFQKDKERNTAYSTILVAMDGERTILEYRGANDYLSEKEIDFENLKSDWIYIDSLAGNIKLLEDILDWAKKNGIKTAFNPGKRMINLGEKLQPYLAQVDIFLANEDESALIAGMEYKEENEPEIFAKLDKIVKGIVVMSKGPRGVEVSDGKNHYIAGIPDSPVVERTGAGDAFGSGFVCGYIQSNGNIEHAIQLGTANATSVVQYFGSKKGILKKGDWGEYPKIKVETIY